MVFASTLSKTLEKRTIEKMVWISFAKGTQVQHSLKVEQNALSRVRQTSNHPIPLYSARVFGT